MFSKAKRFDDKPVGCGADVAYEVKKIVKPIGGVIPRSDRFVEPKPPASIQSDTESVHSDKSSQVFRTPRSKAFSSATKKPKEHLKKEISSEILQERLDEAKTEIRSKDVTLAENDFEIEDMKKTVFELKNKLQKVVEIIKKCSSCSDNNGDLLENFASSSSNDEENDLNQTKIQMYCEKITTLITENESLRVELNYTKKSNEESEAKLREQLNILNEEVCELENELKEFNLNLSYEDEENLCQKLTSLKNILRKQHGELDTLNFSLMHAEKEILDLRDENAELRKNDTLARELTEKIQILERELKEKDEFDEKRSIDILALSDLVNTKDNICKNLMRQMELQTEQIAELNENLALIKQHHALALEANESIRNEYKIEIETIKYKHEEEIAAINKEHKKEFDRFEKEQTAIREKLNSNHEKDLKTTKDNYLFKLKNLEENSFEKLRICEIQFEERLQELQLHHETRFKNEKDSWLKRQDFAQNQIMNLEMQIKEYQDQLDNSRSKINELSETAILYNMEIEKISEDLQNIQALRREEQSAFADQIVLLNNNVDLANIELRKYSVTLETSMHTVDVLKNRLRDADEEVENLKIKLDEIGALKQGFEEKFNVEREAFQNFKTEYNNLLMSIIDSKNHLDKSHNEILDRNNEVIEIIKTIEQESKQEIESLKIILLNDLDAYKCIAMDQIKDLESKLDKEHNLLVEMKNECDKAYKVIDSCQNMIYNAEYQLETKDQEINELATEKDKINGTLAALEEEKNELEVLLKDFKLLAEEKDYKIQRLMEKIEQQDDMINELEEDNESKKQAITSAIALVESKSKNIEELQLKVDTETEEYMEWREKYEDIKTERDNLAELYDELLTKHDTLIHELSTNNSILEEENSKIKSHITSCNKEDLEIQLANVQLELVEVTAKYTDLLGHHNNKQKIKHISDLKAQNYNLKEENEKHAITIQKQNATIEKLKKELHEATAMKSPCASRKQLYLVGKENITSPVNKSPIRLGSPSKLFVLKDLNR